MSAGPYRIPLANALLAFECAARQSSFTLAARELRTSQSVICLQIGQLETWLATRLFQRSRAGATPDRRRRGLPGRRCRLSDGHPTRHRRSGRPYTYVLEAIAAGNGIALGWRHYKRGGWEYAVSSGYRRNVNPDIAAEAGDYSGWQVIERHEALTNRALMRDHRRMLVVAGMSKLRAT